MEVNVTFPLDGRFLRRECEECGRQFKWYSTEGSDTVAAEQYHCPYCDHLADASVACWMTQEQADYVREYAASEVVGPALRELGSAFKKLNSKFLKVTTSGSGPRKPAPLEEPEDMVRVDFECHPTKPLKILETWSGPVHCLVCGTQKQ